MCHSLRGGEVFKVSNPFKGNTLIMKQTGESNIMESKEQESHRRRIPSIDDMVKALDDLMLRIQERRKALLESKENEESFIERVIKEEV